VSATVLVADDSLVIRAVVRTALEDEGYTVIDAVDGAEALRLSRRRPPDVVLLDVEMPGLDGFEVLALLKADKALKDIPVVFLSGNTSMGDVVAGLRGGAHDYLKKPFETAELLARVGSAVHVKQLQDELRQRNDELDRVSRTDALTGLYNRRHIDEQLRRCHTEAGRRHEPVCVVMFDIDHFKAVNDTYGHPVGDLVLQDFAHYLVNELRAADIAGRWGGEEFLVILPRTTLEDARAVAERVRVAVASGATDAGPDVIRVTASAGCALGPRESATALTALADRCLYRAKDAGRNRVVTAGSPPADAQTVADGVRDAFDSVPDLG
jgi:two-component system, cell cycle response regulator